MFESASLVRMTVETSAAIDCDVARCRPSGLAAQVTIESVCGLRHSLTRARSPSKTRRQTAQAHSQNPRRPRRRPQLAATRSRKREQFCSVFVRTGTQCKLRTQNGVYYGYAGSRATVLLLCRRARHRRRSHTQPLVELPPHHRQLSL